MWHPLTHHMGILNDKKRNQKSNVKKMFQPHISTCKSNLYVCNIYFSLCMQTSIYQIFKLVLLFYYIWCASNLSIAHCLNVWDWIHFDLNNQPKHPNGDGAYFKLNTEEIIPPENQRK